MAYGVGGNPAVTAGSNTTKAYTVIDTTVPIPVSGILQTYSIFTKAGGAFKLKIFRDDGTNFLYIGGDAQTAGVGANTFSCSIRVEAGDLIAVYDNELNFLACDNTVGTAYDKSGDVVANSAKATWTARTWTISANGTVFRKGVIIAG